MDFLDPKQKEALERIPALFAVDFIRTFRGMEVTKEASLTVVCISRSLVCVK